MDSKVARRSVGPEQQLRVLKLILNLRRLGDEQNSEKLRIQVRKALCSSEDDDIASTLVDNYIRHAEKVQSKLDGTYEQRQALKRARLETRNSNASRYVDFEAESGDEDEESASEDA